MAWMAAGLGEAFGHFGRGPVVGIGRLGEDPQYAVLGYRATGPAVVQLTSQPLRCLGVHHMLCIEQGDDHVDVEQCAHQMPS